jgi:hypothetical protein
MRDVGEYVHPVGQLPPGDGKARDRVPPVGTHGSDVGPEARPRCAAAAGGEQFERGAAVGLWAAAGLRAGMSMSWKIGTGIGTGQQGKGRYSQLHGCHGWPVKFLKINANRYSQGQGGKARTA